MTMAELQPRYGRSECLQWRLVVSVNGAGYSESANEILETTPGDYRIQEFVAVTVYASSFVLCVASGVSYALESVP
jgi:hypothetical protein